jgi:hypothetical protein
MATRVKGSVFSVCACRSTSVSSQRLSIAISCSFSLIANFAA